MSKSLAVPAVVLACLLALTACGSSASSPSGPAATSGAAPTAASSSAAGACSYAVSGAPAKQNTPPSATPLTSVTTATLITNRGTIPLILTPSKTPCTVNSFVALARQGYFDHTPCHRLTTSGIYVLQCGDPTGTGTGGPGYAFADELTAAAAPPGCAEGGNCVYPAGTVAMANSGPDTNGSQFFLVYRDSPLAYNYTVFGRMSPAGLKVVQQIAAHGAGNPDASGNTPPNESVTITRASVR